MSDSPVAALSAAERRRTAWLACAIAIGLVVMVVDGSPLSDITRASRGDVSIYADYARRLWAGAVPYRDFPVEYPPGAFFAFVAPLLLGAKSDRAYLDVFATLSIAASVAMFGLASRLQQMTLACPIARRRGRWLMVAATLLLAQVLPFRFDVLPALLTLAALNAHVRDRPAESGAWLAAGACVKLYPVVLLPLLGLDLIARGRIRAFWRLIVGAAALTALMLGPVFAIAPHWLTSFLDYHLTRGIQMESLAASLLLLVGQLGLSGHLDIAFGHGSFNVSGAGASTLQGLMSLLMILSIAAVYVAAYRAGRLERHRRDAPTLPLAAFAVLSVFILFNKVLSPQYLIWLLPFAGWLRGRSATAFLGACLLTLAIYPFGYPSLERQRAGAVLCLVLRNALLASCYATTLAELWRAGSGERREAALDEASVTRPSRQ